METQFKQIIFIEIFIENMYSLHELAIYSEQMQICLVYLTFMAKMIEISTLIFQMNAIEIVRTSTMQKKSFASPKINRN